MHDAPVAHGEHEAPQELADVSLMHVPEHECVPAGQAQVELWHVMPPVQAWPQVLQLFGSPVVSTQEVPQGVGAVAGHPEVHL